MPSALAEPPWSLQLLSLHIFLAQPAPIHARTHSKHSKAHLSSCTGLAFFHPTPYLYAPARQNISRAKTFEALPSPELGSLDIARLRKSKFACLSPTLPVPPTSLFGLNCVCDRVYLLVLSFATPISITPSFSFTSNYSLIDNTTSPWVTPYA